MRVPPFFPVLPKSIIFFGKLCCSCIPHCSLGTHHLIFFLLVNYFHPLFFFLSGIRLYFMHERYQSLWYFFFLLFIDMINQHEVCPYTHTQVQFSVHSKFHTHFVNLYWNIILTRGKLRKAFFFTPGTTKTTFILPLTIVQKSSLYISSWFFNDKNLKQVTFT